jgi:hypothetical protein
MRTKLFITAVSVILCSCGAKQTEFRTDTMTMAINDKGHLCSWLDPASAKDYLPKGQPAPLLA